MLKLSLSVIAQLSVPTGFPNTNNAGTITNQLNITTMVTIKSSIADLFWYRNMVSETSLANAETLPNSKRIYNIAEDWMNDGYVDGDIVQDIANKLAVIGKEIEDIIVDSNDSIDTKTGWYLEAVDRAIANAIIHNIHTLKADISRFIDQIDNFNLVKEIFHSYNS